MLHSNLALGFPLTCVIHDEVVQDGVGGTLELDAEKASYVNKI